MASSADTTPETIATENERILNDISTIAHEDADSSTSNEHGTIPIIAPDDPNSQDSLTARFAAFLDATLNPEEFGRHSSTNGDTPAVHTKGALLLPLPNANTNRSQASLAPPEVEPVMELDLDNLPPEILSADIAMASACSCPIISISRVHLPQATTVLLKPHPVLQRGS